MRVFLSYSSADGDIAEKTYFAISGAGHKVFFDKDSLPAGGDYQQRIRRAIQCSDIFVFLISPSSIKEGKFTLAELSEAKKRWPHPKMGVIPVKIKPVPFDDIPNYLKAVTILEPIGNIPAAIASELEDRAHRSFLRRHAAGVWAIALLLLLSVMTGMAWILFPRSPAPSSWMPLGVSTATGETVYLDLSTIKPMEERPGEKNLSIESERRLLMPRRIVVSVGGMPMLTRSGMSHKAMQPASFWIESADEIPFSALTFSSSQ